jgi:hypothetical protein
MTPIFWASSKKNRVSVGVEGGRLGDPTYGSGLDGSRMLMLGPPELRIRRGFAHGTGMLPRVVA